MAYALWTRVLRHNPANPHWPDRDRFVLSAGHGSALLYSLLHLTGYDLPLDELKRFRQWGSHTPGHPEYGDTPGVEVTTGPLGQGFANAVGMAIAERHLAARFNRPGHKVVDHFTYAIAGDGDLMEGVAHEAASLAGHLGLGKLVYLYDSNRICLAGRRASRSPTTSAEVFEGYGWHVQTRDRRQRPRAIGAAIEAAKAVTDRPSIVIVQTHIGYGSPKQDTFGVHGAPLGAEQVDRDEGQARLPVRGAVLRPGGGPRRTCAPPSTAARRPRRSGARASTRTARRTPTSPPSSSG